MGLGLEESARRRLADLAKAIRVDDDQMITRQALVRLSLLDASLPDDLLEYVKRGAGARIVDDRLLPIALSGVGPELAHESLKALGEGYFELPKSAPVLGNGPKHVVDLYFKHLLRGDRIILEALDSGVSPRRAYETYLTAVNRYIVPAHPLRHAEILAIAHRVREFLAELPSESVKEPVICLGGSLVNGRADYLISDVDGASNFELGPMGASDLTRRIRDRMSDYGFDTNLSVHIDQNLPCEFWSEKHPVTIRVSPAGAWLMVYGPEAGGEPREAALF